MRNVGLLLLFSFISTLVLGQSEKPFDFSLIIASCFKADTIKIRVNGQDLIDNEIVNSDFSTGVTELGIYQDNDGLWIQKGKEKIKKEKLTIDRQINLDIIVNRTRTTKIIDIKKGKILFVDNCFVKNQSGQTVQTLTVGQHKKTVRLE